MMLMNVDRAAQERSPLAPCRTIHLDDFLFRHIINAHPNWDYAVEYYLRDGRSSAERLRDLMGSDTAVDPHAPWSLLEFACGYGRMTRHLAEVLPAAAVTACDIHAEAVDFVRREFGVEAVPSTRDPLDFSLDRQFDVVLALSFFSHMPEATFGDWLEVLFRHVRPGGSLIFTTHGQIARTLTLQNGFEFAPNGFWFRAESEQLDLDHRDYGITMCSAKYVTRQISQRLGGNLVLLEEAGWWNLQDVYVVAKT